MNELQERLIEAANSYYDVICNDLDLTDEVEQEGREQIEAIVTNFLLVRDTLFPELHDEFLENYAEEFGIDLYATCANHTTTFENGGWRMLKEKTVDALCEWCKEQEMNH